MARDAPGLVEERLHLAPLALRLDQPGQHVAVPPVEGFHAERHPSAAALPKVRAESVVAPPRRPPAGCQRGAGLAQSLPLQTAAADRAVKSPIRPHGEGGPFLPRRRPSHAMHADESAGPVCGDDRGKLAPNQHVASPQLIGRPRTAWQARRRASGVAGAWSGTGRSGASAWTASASAQKTLFASIKGGSPTALER